MNVPPLSNYQLTPYRTPKVTSGLVIFIIIMPTGVVTASTMAERHDELQQIYQSYVLRDVSEFFRIEHTGVFNNLTTLLAGSVGSPVQRTAY